MLDACPVHHDAPRHTLSHPLSHNESCPVSGKPCIKLLLGSGEGRRAHIYPTVCRANFWRCTRVELSSCSSAR